jgi:DnaJ-class molecular chaperone
MKANGSMRDMQRLDQLHSFLKERHPTYLLDYNIEICKPCKGTGLDIIVTNDGKDFGWDCNSLCKECNGVGFTNIDLGCGLPVEDKFLCRNCDGVGCIDCENEGLVDWVSHCMGR